MDIALGPFSIHDEVSIPVTYGVDVCQKGDVREQEVPSDCLRFFMHGDGSDRGNGRHVQDADVRPTGARLAGRVDLVTTGGWNALVAASVARKAIGLMVVSAVLLLLWRLLANSAAGTVVGARVVRQVRGIGWLLVFGSVINAGLGLGLAVSSAGGYVIVQFGAGPTWNGWARPVSSPLNLLLAG